MKSRCASGGYKDYGQGKGTVFLYNAFDSFNRVLLLLWQFVYTQRTGFCGTGNCDHFSSKYCPEISQDFGHGNGCCRWYLQLYLDDAKRALQYYRCAYSF